jgi:hypothetical protein
MNVNRVAETTNIGESNGTNLRPVLPILFLIAYENHGVFINTPPGQLA